MVHDGAAQGAMGGRPGFARCYGDHYLKKCPHPPRAERPITPDEAAGGGLDLVYCEDYILEWPFDLESYVTFMMTQSNITAAGERGQPADEIRADRLASSPKNHFGDPRRRLLFGGYIWYLRRRAGER